MEKLEPSYNAGGNVKWGSNFERVWLFLRKLNRGLTYGSAIPLLTVDSGEIFKCTHTKTYKLVFIAPLFTIPRSGNYLNVQIPDGIVRGRCINWNIVLHSEGIPCWYILQHGWTWKNVSPMKETTKDHVLYGSICRDRK